MFLCCVSVKFISDTLASATHQGCGCFSIHRLQIDLLVLLLFLPSFAAALDADTQAAEQNQQTASCKDGVDRPSRHCGDKTSPHYLTNKDWFCKQNVHFILIENLWKYLFLWLKVEHMSFMVELDIMVNWLHIQFTLKLFLCICSDKSCQCLNPLMSQC